MTSTPSMVAHAVATRRAEWERATENARISDAADALDRDLRGGVVHHRIALAGRAANTFPDEVQARHDHHWTLAIFRKALQRYVETIGEA